MSTAASPSTIFDQEHYRKLIDARGAFIASFVPALRSAFGFSTALDAGCGLGFFADLLSQQGLSVTAFDGRQKNVEEARERFPRVAFRQGNIEDPSILALGAFDLVLCFGLLYHLENPFVALRHLRRLTSHGLLLESMCLPGEEPVMQLREEPPLDDQSLTDAAFYPSEGCLVKMLYRAGFTHVYKAQPLPDHEQFQDTPQHLRRRTVLFASFRQIDLPGLILYGEPPYGADPWLKTNYTAKRVARRALNFLRKPGHEKFRSFAFRWVRRFPLPLRLSFGAWWIARDTTVDLRILGGAFEDREVAFVSTFLLPGMTVLDLGAHHGYFSLLFSKLVGASGRVFAFEPSERERQILETHLRINFCSNVQISSSAVGSYAGDQELYQVLGSEDCCNSLRPPAVDASTLKVRVPVSTLDDFLNSRKITSVDFVKIDVEGGERDVLLGAHRLFSQERRPIFLVEVSDMRTAPWGYPAKEILRMFADHAYDWFEISPDGRLSPAPSRDVYDLNLVFIPAERKQELTSLFSR